MAVVLGDTRQQRYVDGDTRGHPILAITGTHMVVITAISTLPMS